MHTMRYYELSSAKEMAPRGLKPNPNLSEHSRSAEDFLIRIGVAHERRRRRACSLLTPGFTPSRTSSTLRIQTEQIIHPTPDTRVICLCTSRRGICVKLSPSGLPHFGKTYKYRAQQRRKLSTILHPDFDVVRRKSSVAGHTALLYSFRLITITCKPLCS